jgi:hypothetical protein
MKKISVSFLLLALSAPALAETLSAKGTASYTPRDQPEGPARETQASLELSAEVGGQATALLSLFTESDRPLVVTFPWEQTKWDVATGEVSGKAQIKNVVTKDEFELELSCSGAKAGAKGFSCLYVSSATQRPFLIKLDAQ